MLGNLISWFRRKREARRAVLMFERQVIVKFDDAGIAAAYPGGEIQAILWSEVQCVAIETNDGGPWGADVWWLLESATQRCAYPGGASGEQEALAEYPKRFHGFSDAAVVEAMGSISNARFVCWQRSHAL